MNQIFICLDCRLYDNDGDFNSPYYSAGDMLPLGEWS